MGYNSGMANENLAVWVDEVLIGAMSMNQAAKRAGVAPTTLMRKVKADPRYLAAEAAGKLQKPVADRDDPAMEQHSAQIKQVVDERLSYNEAARRFGGSATRWMRWVGKKYPKYAQARAKVTGELAQQGAESLADRILYLEQQVEAIAAESKEVIERLVEIGILKGKSVAYQPFDKDGFPNP